MRTLIILLCLLPFRVNSKEVGKERETEFFFKRFSAVPGNFPKNSHLCCNPFSVLIALQAEARLFSPSFLKQAIWVFL